MQSNTTKFRSAHIYRADLQIQKLDINDEATMQDGINRPPDKVITIPKESLVNCSMQ